MGSSRLERSFCALQAAPLVPAAWTPTARIAARVSAAKRSPQGRSARTRYRRRQTRVAEPLSTLRFQPDGGSEDTMTDGAEAVAEPAAGSMAEASAQGMAQAVPQALATTHFRERRGCSPQ
jgi:hypothetical protein